MPGHDQVTHSNKLGVEERKSSLAALQKHELDVLVIGGGIVGVGCALDAVTRGLSTGVLEAADWASGTSSRSSKLVHGGIRYLEQLNFRLVREALIERGLLLQRIAPHLVKPVRFLYPLTLPILERLYVGIGMLMYDLFARTGSTPPGVPHHRHLTRRQLEMSMPSLKRGFFRGGLSYWDAQVDDSRYVSMLVRTAVEYGAHAANQVSVTGFLKEGERVVGVRAHDRVSGKDIEIRAKQVVNATGVWTGETQAMVGGDRQFSVRASKGIHLVIPREKFQGTMGILLRTEKSVLFVIPWDEHWLIGTTDTDWHLDKAHPAATATDIDYVLGHVNRILATELTREDVSGVYAGLRPLLSGESEETSKLSREHIVAAGAPGLTLVAGGKWTTYRVMAKDAIDAAVAGMPGQISESVTDKVSVLGADGYVAYANATKTMAKRSGLSQKQISHLLNRYGTLIDDLLEMISENPTLAEPLPGAEQYLAVEAVYAATHEGAVHLEDILIRRTRISIEAPDRGVSAAPVVADLVAHPLGWSPARKRAEVRNYLARVAAERASQLELTDEAAEAVRLQAAQPEAK